MFFLSFLSRSIRVSKSVNCEENICWFVVFFSSIYFSIADANLFGQVFTIHSLSSLDLYNLPRSNDHFKKTLYIHICPSRFSFTRRQSISGKSWSSRVRKLSSSLLGRSNDVSVISSRGRYRNRRRRTTTVKLSPSDLDACRDFVFIDKTNDDLSSSCRRSSPGHFDGRERPGIAGGAKRCVKRNI